MKKPFALILALLGWFALIAQYVIMIQRGNFSPAETTVRYFSYFTILTNLLTALFMTALLLNRPTAQKPGNLTAVACYIFVVGMVYQVLLRAVWHPTGLQKWVDELLHSVIPAATALYWYAFEWHQQVSYNSIRKWVIYPFCYLIFILIRGAFSGFYPYPFVDVTTLGYVQTLLNSVAMTIFFLAVFAGFIRLGKTKKPGS